MASSILVLIMHAPYGLEEAFAGLRLALATGVNGMKTSVVMLKDGVYNAIGSQKPDVLRMPSNVDATKELYDFDVNVFVVREDLAARDISEERLFEGLKVIQSSELKQLLSGHELVVTF